MAKMIKTVTPVTVTPREEMVASTFKMLDADEDHRLNQDELLVFAETRGFQGSESDWLEVYKSLGLTDTGLDLATFDGFVSHEDTDVLADVVKELGERKMQKARTRWPHQAAL